MAGHCHDLSHVLLSCPEISLQLVILSAARYINGASDSGHLAEALDALHSALTHVSHSLCAASSHIASDLPASLICVPSDCTAIVNPNQGTSFAITCVLTGRAVDHSLQILIGVPAHMQNEPTCTIGMCKLLWPAVAGSKSMNELANTAPVLTRDGVAKAFEFLLASPEDRHSELLDLNHAPSVKNLPPAYVVTAEYDVLRDEAEYYAARLHKNGVPVSGCVPLATSAFNRPAGLCLCIVLVDKSVLLCVRISAWCCLQQLPWYTVRQS